jgi:hypothetical protein
MCRLCTLVGRQVQEDSVVVLVLSAKQLFLNNNEDLQAACRMAGLQLYAKGEPCTAVVDSSDEMFFVHNASECASTHFNASEWIPDGVQLSCTTTKNTVINVGSVKTSAIPPNFVAIASVFALFVILASVIIYVAVPVFHM